ncbi:hypothetical protein Barb4_02579 [Bacteroidales bacterium Barb4]|nr:hypothetical protein Barb4_02579 [Bacteroidales bacterium Barb4]
MVSRPPLSHIPVTPVAGNQFGRRVFRRTSGIDTNAPRIIVRPCTGVGIGSRGITARKQSCRPKHPRHRE